MVREEKSLATLHAWAAAAWVLNRRQTGCWASVLPLDHPVFMLTHGVPLFVAVVCLWKKPNCVFLPASLQACLPE